MLQPYKIDMYVYAESKEDADKLEQALKDFVNRQRVRGVAVTAHKLNTLLDKWGENILITNYLR